jgi:hypothetical protein
VLRPVCGGPHTLRGLSVRRRSLVLACVQLPNYSTFTTYAREVLDTFDEPFRAMARVLEVQDYGLALLTGALNLQIWVRARVRARAYVSSHVCVCMLLPLLAC